jgi:hypothetical protein
MEVLAVTICTLVPLYLVMTDVMFTSVHTARCADSVRALPWYQRKESRAAERAAVGVPTCTQHPSHFSRSSRPQGVRGSRPALLEPPNHAFNLLKPNDTYIYVVPQR